MTARTADDPETVRRLVDWGVDAIVTAEARGAVRPQGPPEADGPETAATGEEP